MDAALRLNPGKINSHLDQYPLALLLEDGYLGISISSQPLEGMEGMRELDTAIFLHMCTLPKNQNDTVEYMGIRSHGGIKPENERVFLKAKGALYLDERRSRFWERIYLIIIGVAIGLIVATFSAWIRS